MNEFSEHKQKTKDEQKSIIIWFIPTIFLMGFLLSWIISGSLGSRLGVPSEIPLKKIHNTIISDYYQSPLDDEQLYYESIKGMLKSLDDVYAKFYPPQEFKNFTKVTHGKFAGIGIQIRLENDGYLRVISPIKGTPAEKAGMLSGDKIILVDGDDAKFKVTSEAIEKLSGEPGSKVKLTVQRWLTDETLELELKREIIKSPSVVGAEVIDLEKKIIGYVRLTGFQDSSAKDLENEINNLMQKNISGLILDIRNNSGGQLEITNRIVNLFIPKGKLIVSTQGRNPAMNSSYWTKSDAAFEDLPLVVLVNNDSASASEILAGALQDYQRAVIIGETTYGKGKVQQTYSFKVFDKDSALKFTTALYFTPSGRCIHKSTEKKYCPKCFRLYDEINYANFTFCPHCKEELQTYEPANYYRGGIKPDIEIFLNDDEEEFRIVAQNKKEIIGEPYLSEYEKKVLEKNLVDRQFQAALDVFNNMQPSSDFN